jgi:hypothetical protein
MELKPGTSRYVAAGQRLPIGPTTPAAFYTAGEEGEENNAPPAVSSGAAVETRGGGKSKIAGGEMGDRERLVRDGAAQLGRDGERRGRAGGGFGLWLRLQKRGETASRYRGRTYTLT